MIRLRADAIDSSSCRSSLMSTSSGKGGQMAHEAVVPRSSFLERLMGALRLNPDTYAEVAADREATRQAVAIITVTMVLIGMQSGLSASAQISDVRIVSIIVVFLAVLGVIFMWLAVILYVGLLSAVATMGIRGPETRTAFWRLLRAHGFAVAPGAFQVLRVIPSIGTVIGFAVTLWSCVAGIIAIRKALGVTTGRAFAILIGAGIIVALVAIPLLIMIRVVRGG